MNLLPVFSAIARDGDRLVEGIQVFHQDHLRAPATRYSAWILGSRLLLHFLDLRI